MEEDKNKKSVNLNIDVVKESAPNYARKKQGEYTLEDYYGA